MCTSINHFRLIEIDGIFFIFFFTPNILKFFKSHKPEIIQTKFFRVLESPIIRYFCLLFYMNIWLFNLWTMSLSALSFRKFQSLLSRTFQGLLNTPWQVIRQRSVSEMDNPSFIWRWWWVLFHMSSFLAEWSMTSPGLIPLTH